MLTVHNGIGCPVRHPEDQPMPEAPGNGELGALNVGNSRMQSLYFADSPSGFDHRVNLAHDPFAVGRAALRGPLKLSLHPAAFFCPPL
jgi:hypothetical protein